MALSDRYAQRNGLHGKTHPSPAHVARDRVGCGHRFPQRILLHLAHLSSPAHEGAEAVRGTVELLPDAQ